jgi:hypothetical protein
MVVTMIEFLAVSMVSVYLVAIVAALTTTQFTGFQMRRYLMH